ncbi:MAG: ABC transporter permease [Gemmatimonadota bacterium]
MRETPIWRRYLQFIGSDAASDVDDELRFHLDMRVEDLMRGGLSEADARRQAEREFGDVDRIRGELNETGRRRQRSRKRARVWASLGQDLRFAARTLRRSPGFTAVAVLTLAVGIGGTTAVFSVVKGVLLDPLPYAESGRLVRFYQYDTDDPVLQKTYLSAPHFLEIRRRASSFQDVAALYTYSETGANLAEGGQAERLRILEVGSGYFRVLRAPPVAGRGFEPDDELGGVRMVMSHRLWRTRFGADQGLLGRVVRLSGEPYTVVGIAPEGLEDPIVGPVDAWLSLDLTSASAESLANHYLTMIGRLRGGVTLEQAQAEIASLNQAFATQWPEVADEPVMLVGLKEDLVGGSRGALRLLLLAAGLVLLVACVNVANLFLVRSVGRTREFAIRSSLGSGPGRILRQLLVESGALALGGGLVGIGVAVIGVEALDAVADAALPRVGEVGVDRAVLLFALGLTVATGLGFGLAPALRFARIQPAGALREQGRSTTGSRSLGRMRSGFAVAQMALALMLLAGAGVLLMSFYHLQQVDLGFREEGVLTFDVHLPAARYDDARRAAFHPELIRRLEALPGVNGAAAVSRLPATGTYHSWGTWASTGPLAGVEDAPMVPGEQRVVEGDYFELLGIPLREGRLFDSRDALASENAVAVVSRTVAERLFPGVSALGQAIRAGGQDRTVIGVVEDVALDPEGTPAPGVYHLHAQFAGNRNWALTYVVWTEGSPLEATAAARTALASLDPQLVLHQPSTLAAVVGRGTAQRRFALFLMAVFAGVALLLAALGLYGVLSYGVRQRTREMGVRIALGASAAHVRRLVLWQAAVVVGLGLAGGTVGALFLGRWLSSLTFEVSPSDPRIFAATALLLICVALVSAWVPAWRASRVEPRVAMEAE